MKRRCLWIHFIQILATLASVTPISGYEPEFLEPLENITVTQGREATFTCVVNHLGGYRVAWIKADTKAILAIHNKVITHNNRMNVIHSDHKTWELKIKNVTRNDTGQYMCQINTDPMKMQVGYLNVVIPPDIVNNDTSGDIMTPEGSKVRLTCRARGHPMPVVTWRREDKKPIVLQRHDQKKTEVTEYTGEEMILEKIARDDMGAYMCIASNAIPPAVSKRVVVNVHFHPLVRIPNQLVGAPIGTNITLECDVEASPQSINYWTKLDESGPVIVESKKYNNQIISYNDYTVQLRLTITNLTKKDFTKYSCTAKNSLGEVDGEIKLYEIEISTPEPTSTESTPPPTTTRVMKEGLVGRVPSENRHRGENDYYHIEQTFTTRSSEHSDSHMRPYTPPNAGFSLNSQSNLRDKLKTFIIITIFVMYL